MIDVSRRVVAAGAATALVAGMVALPQTAAADEAPTTLMISTYIEGSSNNKAIELYNPTDAAIDLAATP